MASSPQTKFFHPRLRALAILPDCKSLPGPSASPTSHTYCWIMASQSLHLYIPVTSSRKPSLTTPSPTWGFPDSSVGKESACNAEDPGSIPGLGRSPGEGIGYPLQYSWASLVAHLVRICLQCGRPGFDLWVGKTPWRRERLPTPVFWYTVHGVAKSWTQLSDFHFQYEIPHCSRRTVWCSPVG